MRPTQRVASSAFVWSVKRGVQVANPNEKTVTIGFLRYNTGKMFHEIRERGQSYMLTHGGKPVARLQPIGDNVEILSDGSFKGGIPLTFRSNLGG